MSEDTYAKVQRREWYAESEYQPDVPPETPVIMGSSIHLTLLDSARGWGKSASAAAVAAEAATQGLTFHFSVEDKATKALEELAEKIAGSYTLFAEKLGHVLPKIVTEETPRERALRLKKQPHSMAASNRGWDNRGRRRY